MVITHPNGVCKPVNVKIAPSKPVPAANAPDGSTTLTSRPVSEGGKESLTIEGWIGIFNL